ESADDLVAGFFFTDLLDQGVGVAVAADHAFDPVRLHDPRHDLPAQPAVALACAHRKQLDRYVVPLAPLHDAQDQQRKVQEVVHEQVAPAYHDLLIAYDLVAGGNPAIAREVKEQGHGIVEEIDSQQGRLQPVCGGRRTRRGRGFIGAGRRFGPAAIEIAKRGGQAVLEAQLFYRHLDDAVAYVSR